MRKFITKFTLLFLFVFFISSCSNILGEKPGASFSFGLGNGVSKAVNNAVTEVTDSSEINENTTVDVVCNISRHGKIVSSIAKTVHLSEVGTVKFSYKNIMYSSGYEISVEIFYKGNKIYNGDSDKFILDSNNPAPKINVLLDKTYGKINYEVGSQGKAGSTRPDIYFVSSNLDLSALESTLVIPKGQGFGGWYVKGDKDKKVITHIGSSQFLGDVTLCPIFKDITPPAEVTNLIGTVSPDATSVTLKWKNPNDADFTKVVISISPADVDGVTLESQVRNVAGTYEFKGLTNGGKTYTFTVKTVDTNGNASAGKTIKCITNGKYTTRDTPTTVGSGSIYYFGDWPQTLKEDSVSIDEAQATIDIHGWTCYLGSDNNYYVKTKMTPYKAATGQSEGNGYSGYLTRAGFETQPTAESTAEYYFKLEPIKWKVMQDNFEYSTGSVGKLLVTEKVLMTGQFQNNGNEINYNTSSIRDKLINTSSSTSFINQAFNADSQNKLLGYNKVSGDRVFILSKDEDKLGEGAPNSPVITDFAYASGVRWKWIMTRTTNATDKTCFEDGSTESSQAGQAQNGCVLPAIVIANN